jgi:hypothetical protein
MRYLDASYGSTLLPKLLGTYEKELHGQIEQLCRVPFSHVVDIGAAEGYYAVGLARRIATARVSAFELNPSARHLIRVLSKLNGVGSRIHVLGQCTIASLSSVLRDELSLVVCDCEGAEDVLLCPDQVPGLKAAWILVETHDYVSPRITESIQQRFCDTHDVHRFEVAPRQLSDFPLPLPSPDSVAFRAMDELRPAQQSWLALLPRSSSSETAAH